MQRKQYILFIDFIEVRWCTGVGREGRWESRKECTSLSIKWETWHESRKSPHDSLILSSCIEFGYGLSLWKFGQQTRA